MTRAVVDTNSFIRAVVMPSGAVGPIMTRLRARNYALVYSALVIDELLSRLALPRIRQKYHLTDQDVDDLLALIALRGELVTPPAKYGCVAIPRTTCLLKPRSPAWQTWWSRGMGTCSP